MTNTSSIQLTIADLTMIKQIIDVACTRGAFKAAEVKTVGETFEKLDQFLTSVTEQAERQLKESKQETESTSADQADTQGEAND